ncbi:hypothetical protein IWW57_002854 [Coemansia sp. S610]|nr:hypothetical protein IWW57_002854 [Coemansia sp. S610]
MQFNALALLATFAAVAMATPCDKSGATVVVKLGTLDSATMGQPRPTPASACPSSSSDTSNGLGVSIGLGLGLGIHL